MARRVCDLCQLPIVGRPLAVLGSDSTDTARFCCEGCRRVWLTARDAGILDRITAHPRGDRTTTSERKRVAAAALGARRVAFGVSGMWCSSCASVLEDAVLDLDGVLDVEVSYGASLARVTFDPALVGITDVRRRVELLGYAVRDVGDDQDDAADVQDLFLRLFVGVVVNMWVMWPTLFVLYPEFSRGVHTGLEGAELLTGVLSTVVLLYSGWPLITGAVRAARVGRATMDTLVVVGTVSAWAYSVFAALTRSDATYFESVAMIVVIVLAGRWIEAVTRRSAAARLGSLVRAEAAMVWRLDPDDPDGDADRVALVDVLAGDLIIVRPGERIHVDGTVTQGVSAVDQSRITGEPLPMSRAEGDDVWAGSINISEPLRVRVAGVAEQTLEGRLAEIVEDAAFAKGNAERLVDAVSRVFVPLVLGVAAMTAISSLLGGLELGEALRRAVSVLVVACPCALGLATPLVVQNALAAAVSRGFVVRGAHALEQTGTIGVVAVDKTGTLTEGRARVTGHIPATAPEDATREVLRLAASVQVGRAHPLGDAIAQAGREADVTRLVPDRVSAVPGQGVEADIDGYSVLVGSHHLLESRGVAVSEEWRTTAEKSAATGASIVWIARAGECIGGLELSDGVRPESAAAVAALRQQGVDVVMVSGDASGTCEALGEVLGISRVHAEVMPHEKAHVVQQLRSEARVAFVGDGVNDAAALTTADLAIAMPDASELAAQAADVILLREGGRGLAAIPDAIALSRAARRVIIANLVWAFTYNAVALPLAMIGRLTPIVAALAMVGSSLAVIANSTLVRLLSRRSLHGW